MGPIKLTYVIRYSSQDDYFKAENLLHDPTLKPWLCSRNDKSGHLEAEYQLERASCIDFIDLGNMESSTIEIQVGKSEFQEKTLYLPFLPAVQLLTLANIKAGMATNSIYMFNKSNFNQLVAAKKWDRIKVICSHPYKKKMQFGLSLLSLRTSEVFPKFIIEDHTSIDKSKKRPPKCVSEKSSYRISFDDILTRGKKLLNASKYRKSVQSNKKLIVKRFVKHMSSQPSTSSQMQMSSQPSTSSQMQMSSKPSTSSQMQVSSHQSTSQMIRGDILNFLIACFEEDKLNNAPEYYITHFTQQRKKSLTSEEEKIFCDSIFEVIMDNLKEDEWEQNDASEVDLGNRNNTKVSPLSLPKSKAQKMDNLLDLLINKEEKPSTISPKIKECFLRCKDSTEPDDVKPSTSSGIIPASPRVAHCQCPICREYFPEYQIEAHAAYCGEVPVEMSSNQSQHSLYSDNQDSYMPCPLCMFSFHKSELSKHAETCSPVSSNIYGYNLNEKS